MRVIFMRKQFAPATGRRVIIILSGPPKAGKSRLRGDIGNLLRQMPWLNIAVLIASPDMEGQWVSDSWRVGEERGRAAEEMAREYKRTVKESGHFFSPQWVERMTRHIEGLSKWADILVLDLGGLPSEENKQIVAPALASGAIIIPIVLLGPNRDDGGWIQFWRDLGYEPDVVTYSENLAQEIINSIKTPPMEVVETADAYIVRLEIPGVRPEDIEVTLTGDTLTIKGKRERSEEQEDETYHLTERAYDEFVRSITLPSAVDPENISVDYKDGVLELRLPKAQKELSRRIPINTTRNT